MRTRRPAVILIPYVVLLLSLSGCLVDLQPRPPIPVPPNLSDEDAEVVILFEVANQPLPPEFTQGERIADHALQAFLGARYQTVQAHGGWFPEAVEPELLTVSYVQGPFYLRVAVRIHQQDIDLRILDSKNLSQQDNKIHPTALAWLDALETGIRRALGCAATIRRLGMGRPPPVSRGSPASRRKEGNARCLAGDAEHARARRQGRQTLNTRIIEDVYTHLAQVPMAQPQQRRQALPNTFYQKEKVVGFSVRLLAQ